MRSLLPGICAGGVTFAGLLPLVPAHAQEALINPVENGPVGLAGMLAGLLIFALIALYNHQRRSRGLAQRISALEAALEARDDNIWALEERIARATELVDAQGDLVLREDAHGWRSPKRSRPR
jgi:hypothetical protein